MVRFAWGLAAWMGAASFAWSRPAEAQDARATISAARRNIELGRAADAQQAIDAMLQAGGLAPSELAAAYEITALAFASQGDAESAEGAFTSMLAIEPDRRPRGRHAKQAAGALGKAKTTRADVGPLRVEGGVEHRWRSGKAPVLPVSVHGDLGGMVARVEVQYRLAGRGDFTQETAQGAGPHRVILNALASESPGTIEWYAIALDDFGNQLAMNGSSAAPQSQDPSLLPDAPGEASLALAPISADSVDTENAFTARGGAHREDEDEGGGILSKWWFWTGLAVLAGGGAGLYLYTQKGDEPNGNVNPVCFGGDCDAVLEAE